MPYHEEKAQYNMAIPNFQTTHTLLNRSLRVIKLFTHLSKLTANGY